MKAKMNFLWKAWRDVGSGPGSTEGQFVDWLTIKDRTAGVVADVKRIRPHPLVPLDIAIYGYIYNVETGRLIEVPEAMKPGRAELALVAVKLFGSLMQSS